MGDGAPLLTIAGRLTRAARTEARVRCPAVICPFPPISAELATLAPSPEHGVHSGAEALALLAGGPCYLASPYSWWAERGAADDAAAAAAIWTGALMTAGVAVISPIVTGHSAAERLPPMRAYSHGWWMSRCLPLLAASAGVVVPDICAWRLSRGVAMEVGWALVNQRPVILLDHGDLLEAMA